MKILRLYRHLGIRIALFIVITGPIVFFIFMNLAYFGAILLGSSRAQNALWVVLAVISTPLAMGFVAAWYINRYFKQLANAIEKLSETKNTKTIQPSNIIEFNRVISKFNNLQHRLDQEEKLRQDLIMDASHEFNTPLTALNAQLIGMKDGLLEPNEARLNVLIDHTMRLNELVESLDAYAKAQLPSHIQKQSISLAEICNKIALQYDEQWKIHHMKLTLDIPNEYSLKANQIALEHIITNLFQNAFRYSQGSVIEVSTNKSGFSISDNGIGVAAKHRNNIFERFYRVDKSRNRATGGMGLGLAIVYELARSQNWEVKAEDNHPGLKIIFTFSSNS